MLFPFCSSTQARKLVKSAFFIWKAQVCLGDCMLGKKHSYYFQLQEVILNWFSSVQLLSRVWHFATPWTETHQAFLSITNSWSTPKPISIELVMLSNYLILCRPLLLLPSIFPSIRVFSNKSALCIRWLKYWSFSYQSVLPMNTQDWSPLGWTGWISLYSKGVSRVFSNTIVQKHQFFGTQLSL